MAKKRLLIRRPPSSERPHPTHRHRFGIEANLPRVAFRIALVGEATSDPTNTQHRVIPISKVDPKRNNSIRLKTYASSLNQKTIGLVQGRLPLIPKAAQDRCLNFLRLHSPILGELLPKRKSKMRTAQRQPPPQPDRPIRNRRALRRGAEAQRPFRPGYRLIEVKALPGDSEVGETRSGSVSPSVSIGREVMQR